VPELAHLLTSNVFLIIDTLLVAVAMYYVLLYVRGTKTAVLLQALIIVGTLYFFCQYFKLITLAFLLERLLLIGPLAVIVIFAPEIRALLERASKRSHFIELLLPQGADDEVELPEQTFIDIVVTAVAELASHKVGALIVIERGEQLLERENLIISGTRLDAVPSVRLLTSVFEESNPLHDGAIIIRDNRIHSAGNFLPMSENNTLAEELGTRHRAGLGLAERTDAVVTVVSQERGEISIAFHGRLARHLTLEQFASQLRALLEPNENFSTIVQRAAYI
jgi:diadenylate cyclase